MLSAFCLTNKNESEQTIMKRIKINPIFIIFVIYLSVFLTARIAYATNEISKITYVNSTISHVNEDKLRLIMQEKITAADIIYEYGNVDWLPELALEVGWPAKTIENLKFIILRESGGCPNRRGGDKVDKACNITGVAEWNHRSDSGLLQINGVNYDISRNKWAPICKQMDICSKDDQWQLLDAKTNLKAGLILYELVGWSPWDACGWDPSRCSKSKN